MRTSLRAPRNRYGQALVEYALVVALVGTGLGFALLNLRNSIGNTANVASNRIAQTAGCSYADAAACAAMPSDPGSGGGNGNGNNGNGNGNGGGNGSNSGGNGNGNGGGKK
jgi:hypothetical protein